MKTNKEGNLKKKHGFYIQQKGIKKFFEYMYYSQQSNIMINIYINRTNQMLNYNFNSLGDNSECAWLLFTFVIFEKVNSNPPPSGSKGSNLSLGPFFSAFLVLAFFITFSLSDGSYFLRIIFIMCIGNQLTSVINIHLEMKSSLKIW